MEWVEFSELRYTFRQAINGLGWVHIEPMTVTIVVPTFNRGPKITRTLECLFANETGGLETVEVLVVDDGSKQEAESFWKRQVNSPFLLRWIRQQNSGPAAARNGGFREASGELVVFVDDDILVPPDFLQKHVAAHRMKPGSVIFGPCVLKDVEHSIVRFLNEIYAFPCDGGPLIRVDFLASGQLSAEKETLNRLGGPYCETLRTPGAEEFALMSRIQELGIEIYHMPGVIALHDQPLDLRGVCLQQYKHGMGYSEFARKYRSTGRLDAVQRVLSQCGPVSISDPILTVVRKSVRTIFSSAWNREVLVRLCQGLERIAPYRVTKMLYRGLIGLYFAAGLRAGWTQFETQQQA